MKQLVNKDVVVLRSKPCSQSSAEDEVLYGMPVEILEDAGDWVKVITEYKYVGYCQKSELYGDDNDVTNWIDDSLEVVMQRYADVLSLPKVQGICLQSITRGGRIKVVSKNNPSWTEVELVDGTHGFIKAGFLGPYYSTKFTNDEQEFRNRVVEMAKGYLGTQYRWAGKSTLGIDCSGLTSMSYMLCGVLTYRDAKIVEGFPVHPILKENLQKGDLIYFPGHIAMYIGNGEYIHSTAKDGSDGVVINSLNEDDENYREDLPKIITAYGSIF